MRQYVVGLLFDEGGDNVVLIHKRHGPPCVVGRWNGVGGKVELGEDFGQAMRREFEEEAGVNTDNEHWSLFCILQSGEHEVAFFESRGDVTKVRTMTDEEVEVFNTKALPDEIMHNLRWMIPFALDPEVRTMNIIEVLRSDR